jgi:acyl-coenzyme A thioesterase PaaI-like protein
MHNVEVLVKGKARCTLQINPDDAAELGVVDGGKASVRAESAKSPLTSRSPTS